ncbi:replication initiator protein [Salmonella enterica]|nr:replication initiator protein [Salmonella enterica]
MGSCAVPSAKDGNQFTTTRYLQQCRLESLRRLLGSGWESVFTLLHLTPRQSA